MNEFTSSGLRVQYNYAGSRGHSVCRTRSNRKYYEWYVICTSATRQHARELTCDPHARVVEVQRLQRAALLFARTAARQAVRRGRAAQSLVASPAGRPDQRGVLPLTHHPLYLTRPARRPQPVLKCPLFLGQLPAVLRSLVQEPVKLLPSRLVVPLPLRLLSQDSLRLKLFNSRLPVGRLTRP